LTLFAVGLIYGLSVKSVYSQEGSFPEGFIFTQQQDEPTWKTYLYPSKFSIDYPDFGSETNITNKNMAGDLDDKITISSPRFYTTIDITHNIGLDVGKHAEIARDVRPPDTAIVNELETVQISGKTGYTFTLQFSNGLLLKQVFFEHRDQYYDFNFWIATPERVQSVYQPMIESIKFLWE